MPIYEYECSSCLTRFERSQRFSDPPVSECPECGSAVRRVLFPAGIVFKGSGWYVTDSRKSAPSESSASSGTSGAPATSTDGKSDAKPADAKGGGTETAKGAKSDSKTTAAAPS
jgi:putative FmdB family regulatory protein